MASVKLTKISQTFERQAIADLAESVRAELSSVEWRLPPGASVAIGVGSRGIANLVQIVQAVVRFVEKKGCRPFVVPAMGSHGGATAAGQKQILAAYGVTEERIGCLIRSSMDVVELPGEECGCKIFTDRFAHEADGVLLINRIKPHTDFHATYESGLVKMTVIGLGKEKQASEIHKYGVRGLKELVPRVAERIFATGKIVAGIGIVENAYEETAAIEAITADRILQREPDLLELARRYMPRLPINDVDVLIVDRMGKDISGVGIDPNIIGRIKIKGQEEPKFPNVAMLMVSDLTEASHGNAVGVGLADVTTAKLQRKIDFPVMLTNVVVSGFLERGKLPVVADTDELAFAYALRACGYIPAGAERIVRIKDTLHLSEVYVSPAVLNEIEPERLHVLGESVDLFDANGSLCEF